MRGGGECAVHLFPVLRVVNRHDATPATVTLGHTESLAAAPPGKAQRANAE